MKKTLFKYFVELTGNPVASSLLKSVTTSRLSQPLIQPFSSTYRINEAEMEHPIHHYNSLQALFTRQLKEGSRQVDVASNTIVSPVDGVLSGVGKINADQAFLIKNHQYRLNDIMGTEKKQLLIRMATTIFSICLQVIITIFIIQLTVKS